MTRSIACALALAAASAGADPFPSAAHVYVEGSAEIRIEPDQLELAVVIDSTDLDLAAAKATVDARSRQLIAASRELGVAREDIRSANLQISPEYDYRGDRREFLGTRVGREIEIVLRDLEQYPALIRAIVSAPIGKIRSAALKSSRASKVLEEAQLAALADARARAERLAAAAGQRLGAAYSISEFDYRATERYLLHPSRDVGRDVRPAIEGIVTFGAESREEPFEPGTIAAFAKVYVMYLIEPE